MKTHEILLERILNLHTNDEKRKYADEVWDLLQKSYDKIGGFKSASSVDELIDNEGYWKIVRRDGKITAANLYRKVPQTNSYKIYASGAETTKKDDTYFATDTGKKDYQMVKKDDVKMNRSWAEVSGPAEKNAKRLGALPVPNMFAAYLTNKEIIELNDDGYHYTRLIMGKPYEKIIYGFIGLTDEQKKSLENSGLDINQLPQRKA